MGVNLFIGTPWMRNEGVFKNMVFHVLVLHIIQIDHANEVKVTKARKVVNIRNGYNQVPHLK